MQSRTANKTKRSWLDMIRRQVLILVGVTLPFEYTSLGNFLVQLTPNKIVTIVLVVFVALQFVLEQRALLPDRKRGWLLFFGLAVSISAIPSIAGNVPNDVVRRELVTTYSMILFYFALQLALRDRSDIDLILRSFAVGCLIAILTGWFGYGNRLENTEFTRIGGEGGGPNLLAFNLLVVIAGSASLFFSTRSRLGKGFYAGSIAIFTMGLITTFSRSGYIGFMAMGGLWALRSGRVGIVKYALPGILLLSLAVIFAPQSAYERASTLTPEGIMSEDSGSGRVRMFGETAKALMSNPITGVGLRGFVRWAYEHDMKASGIHSAYLRVAAENGLLGLIPFIAVSILAWTAFTKAWRLARRHRALRDPELDTLYLRAVLLQIGYFGALVMAQVQPATYHKSLWLLFAISSIVLALVRERVAELVPESDDLPSFGGASAATPALEAGFRSAPR